MPVKSITWKCGECDKTYQTYEEAEQCESNHIAQNVGDKFKAELSAIMKTKSPKTKRRPLTRKTPTNKGTFDI